MFELIAEAASSINVFSMARRIAAFNVPVLIHGETGTGKECIAKFIHSIAFAQESQAPYIGVNCAAIPENMLEATLFGYDKGAFTGAVATVPGKMELANNGTLLLDEIGDMPLALQAKILRVLQEQQVERLGSNRLIKLNFRLIACTNKNLEEEVAAGRFREDLYYRLSVIPLTMPRCASVWKTLFRWRSPLSKNTPRYWLKISSFLNRHAGRYSATNGRGTCVNLRTLSNGE